MPHRQILKFKLSKRFGALLYPSKKLTYKQHTLLQKQGKGAKKASTFSAQLRARQLLSSLYGKINTTYLYTLFKKSLTFNGKAGHNFLSLLEQRLDTVLCRAYFTPTFSAARQMIAHKKIRVNNQTVAKAGYLLQPGDIISLDPKIKQHVNEKIRSFIHLQETLGTLRKKQRVAKRSRAISIAKMFWFKPLNIEVSYKMLQIVFLFSPQQIYYSARIDLDLITKAFQR